MFSFDDCQTNLQVENAHDEQFEDPGFDEENLVFNFEDVNDAPISDEPVADSIDEPAVPTQDTGGPATRTRKRVDLSTKQFVDATGVPVNLTEDDPEALLASCDPLTVDEALDREDSKEWKIAMKSEYDALISQKTWETVPRPKGKNVIKTKWVFRKKYKSDGSIEKYKARMVAKGFSQKPGVDYQEVFAPVVRYDTVRFLLSIAAEKKLSIKQVDVVGAFLYGDLEEDIFIEEPEGFQTCSDGSKVCRLKKALYGLKQAPRQWNKKFNAFLMSAGLKATDADPCLYTNKDHTLLFAPYVDDGLLVAKDPQLLNRVIRQMESQFNVTVGEAEFFVGIQIEQQSDGIFIHQSAYTERILERFKMTDCNATATPSDISQKMLKESENMPADGTITEKFPYRELIGSVMFLMICSRPDISCAVSLLSQYLDNPTQQHVVAAKRVLRYLQGTKSLGIKYSGSSPLIGYSDADYAGDEATRRSRTGMVFVMNGGPIVWLSQKQTTVSTSKCEAELTAAFTATKEAVWLRQMLSDVGRKPLTPTPLNVDNQGTLKYILNPVLSSHKRSKHWDVRLKYTKEMQAARLIDASFVSSKNQLADIFTKPLSAERFNYNVSMLNLMQIEETSE